MLIVFRSTIKRSMLILFLEKKKVVVTIIPTWSIIFKLQLLFSDTCALGNGAVNIRVMGVGLGIDCVMLFTRWTI